ncbi:hypothetical protein [Absidia glauca]|uniref:Uncharacterized protein n=1 Tax=Absidia glauca TaxID=4829 RepID=A0A163J1Y4_ABSGL|nr:hypothetical protein [Absidia glauca]
MRGLAACVKVDHDAGWQLSSPKVMHPSFALIELWYDAYMTWFPGINTDASPSQIGRIGGTEGWLSDLFVVPLMHHLDGVIKSLERFLKYGQSNVNAKALVPKRMISKRLPMHSALASFTHWEIVCSYITCDTKASPILHTHCRINPYYAIEHDTEPICNLALGSIKPIRPTL